MLEFHCFHYLGMSSNHGNRHEMTALVDDWWGWSDHCSGHWQESITKTAQDVRSAEMLFNPVILESHNCQHRSKQLSRSMVPNLFQLEEQDYARTHCQRIPLLVLFEKAYNGQNKAHGNRYLLKHFALP